MAIPLVLTSSWWVSVEDLKAALSIRWTPFMHTCKAYAWLVRALVALVVPIRKCSLVERPFFFH